MPIDKLAISSPDIQNLGRIGDEYSQDGERRIPRLEFSGAPDGTVELAVVVHDPDAPMRRGFTHWTVYGIPGDATSLDLDAVRQGPNETGEHAWYGPQPPFGHGVHHYYFWVYALSRPVSGTPTRADFLDDYADAILEQARFVGTYSR